MWESSANTQLVNPTVFVLKFRSKESDSELVARVFLKAGRLVCHHLVGLRLAPCCWLGLEQSLMNAQHDLFYTWHHGKQ